ncbi:MAG: hypothetical protein IH827_05795 [Myxococcales bacterium]|nr:hypothetical protein [Myxococcales bacterium]
MSRLSSIACALLGALMAPWGCSTPPPPASSLPGKLAVESAGSIDLVTANAEGVNVPAAAQPREGQIRLPKPDPDDGAGTLLVYTAITGQQPFGPGSTRPAPSEPGRWTAEGEQSRGRSLEAQIEEELRRQQLAIESLDSDLSEQPTVESLITGQSVAERANPRVAPDAPKDRELPMSVFEMEPVTIMAGSWGNEEAIEVTRGVLDADRDGVPEQIRFFDPDSMLLLRLEQDSNFDGNLDIWNTYTDGKLTARVRDTSGDGNADVWERYEGDRMTHRTIDRDHDGVADAFYIYGGGILVEERHDANNDGIVDRQISYQNLFRVRAEEDRDFDGNMDVWTTYGISHGKEVVERVEQATKGSGPPDRIETYDTSTGKSQLSKLEEDRNGDGTVDVTSYYENGKLVQREISDPDLAPL